MNKNPDKPLSTLRFAAEFKHSHQLKSGTVECKLSAEELLHELNVHQIELEMQNEQLRLTQIELTQSRDRYIDFYNFAPVGYFTLNVDGMIDEVNLTASSLLGLEQNKLMHHHFASLVTTEDGDRWHLYFRSVLKSDKTQTCELSLQRADASHFYVRLDCISLMHNGEVTKINVVLTDITEHKIAANKIAASEEQYRRLVENSPFCIHTIDQEGCLLSMNKVGLDMLGLDNEKRIYGVPYLNAVSEQDYERIKALMLDAFNGTSSHFEFVGTGNMPLYFKSCFIPIYDSENKIIALMGLTENITERKQAEKELRIAAIAFESQEGMTITDVNGSILKVNNAFTEITGYTIGEVMGKNPRILQSGRHDKSFFEDMWKRITSMGVWEGEIWNRRKSGEVYPEYLTITAVKDTNGAVTNYVATMTDITMRKSAEDEIKHLAFYDPLTRLPNRRLLMDRLQQALTSSKRSGIGGALLFIDLDNFKSINDTLGHEIGDILLQQVSTRLESCVREGDTVARFGGDEFVVMLEGLSNSPLKATEHTESVADKILATLNQPYQLKTHEHHNTPSIGATLFNDNGLSIDEILKQADIAMYQSKKAGRNSLHFFDPIMQPAPIEELEARLK